MTGQGTPGNRLGSAAALLGVGRTDSARELLSQALSAEPENVEALCLLARSYQVDENYPAMRAAAEQAVAVAPEQYEGHVLLAFAQVELDRAESALASAQEAVRLGPHDWRGPAALALAWFNLGYRRRGFRAIRRAIELAPHLADPQFIRGGMFQAIGWTVGAKRCYRRALALDPEHTGALAALAQIAVSGNRLTAASGHLSSALATAPTDHTARTELDRMLIGGLAGWALMGVWFAGAAAMFAMLSMMWLLPLAVLTLSAWWVRRSWSGLAPGIRAYAVHLMRTDIRARVRLAGLAVSALTGAGLGVAAALQSPDEPPSAAWLIFAGAHMLALIVTGTAITIADRKVAGPPRSPGGAAGPPPTDLLAERRQDADTARWVLRLGRTGAVFAVVPWAMTVDAPEPWPTRAIFATVALAAFLAYARWSRRRILRHPGRPNAALGMLVTPLTFLVLADFVGIVASAVLPAAAMPLPDLIEEPVTLGIAAGVLAWLLWLPYAAVRGLIRLLRRRSEESAGSHRLGAQVPPEVRHGEGDGAALARVDESLLD